MGRGLDTGPSTRLSASSESRPALLFFREPRLWTLSLNRSYVGVEFKLIYVHMMGSCVLDDLEQPRSSVRPC